MIMIDLSRKAAARSLSKIKDKRTIKPLIRVLGFGDAEFRYAVKMHWWKWENSRK